jgi:hypothetical protein
LYLRHVVGPRPEGGEDHLAAGRPVHVLLGFGMLIAGADLDDADFISPALSKTGVGVA